MKRKKRDGSHSDLNEAGIFVFLTMVIFFVAVGFPTLIQTSPTFGYEGIEWTPVTTYYQQAYAEQEVLQKLAYFNYNPIVLSAFLVMPTAIDNPPPDPAQYFELKYGQPIQIETGFAETIKPEMVVLKDVNLLFQLGSFVPISWQEHYYIVEKSVFKNLDDDFSPNPLIPSAYGDSAIYVPISALNRIQNNVASQSGTCSVISSTSGGIIAGGGADVQHVGSNFNGVCFFTVFTINPQIPPDMIDTITTESGSLAHRGTMANGDTNYDCGIALLGGVPEAHGTFGAMTPDDVWFNATSPKTAWTTNFNSALCRQSFGFEGTDQGFPARTTRVVDFIERFKSNLHTDGTLVCDPADDTDCRYSYAFMDNNVPFRQGSSKDANFIKEYFKINVQPDTNNTNGNWQIKEHSFYPSGVMDDCNYNRVGDLLRIDSGATDAEQGQCLIFKTIHTGNEEFSEDFSNSFARTVSEEFEWDTTDQPRFDINNVTGKLEIRVDDQNVNADGIRIRLPEFLDKKWTIQIPYTATLTAGTAPEHEVWFVFARDNVGVNPESGTQDCVGAGWRVDSTGEASEKRILTTWCDSQFNAEVVTRSAFLNSTDLGSAMDDGCIEIIRNHHVGTWNFYDDISCTGTPLQTLTRSMLGSSTLDIDELDTVKFMYSDQFSAGTGSIDIDIDSIKIWKGLQKPIADFNPDISVFLNASGTGSSEMRVFVDVMDGTMDMGNLYSAGATVTVTSGHMQENKLREDLGTGQNHRLGITEVDLPFEGEILIKPEYSSGSETIFTVFVGLQDNSTDGTITLDINNVTIGTNFFNFTEPVIRFHEQTDFANPSPIKAFLDTGYVSANASQIIALSLNGTGNGTAPNTGSLGSSADGLYFEDGSLSTFVVNSSGIINEGVIQNGTSSGGGATQGEIHLGSDPSLWDFLTIGNSGSNLTSINFWLLGDVVGSIQYPLISSGTSLDADAFLLYTQSGDIRLMIREANTQIQFGTVFNGIIPADDGQWHMVTVLLNKTDLTGYARVCVDGSGNCDIENAQALHTGTGSSAPDPLTVGDNTHNNAGGIVENTFNVDEITIWNGYSLSNTDIDNMYNSGAGASSDGIGASFQVLDMTFDLQSASCPTCRIPVAPPLPIPNVITSGTVTQSSSLLVDWVHDGINTTGYRIYRTSTEVIDTKVIFDTTTTEDFDIDLNSFESVAVAQSAIPPVEGEMISDFDILLMNDTGNPVTSDGIVRGAVFIDATAGSSTNGTLGISLFNPSASTFVNTTSLPSGLSAFNFKFRGENLVNITTAFPLDIGIGVFANTSFTGDVSVGLCTSGCIGAGTARLFNATTGLWVETAPTDDIVLRVSAVNQTKLFAPAIPLVNDTGSLDTQYLDNATSSQNTFLYRIVALNGLEESDTIVILNGTEGLNINQTETDVVLAIDAGVNALFEVHQSACDSTIGSAFRVACYTFDTVDISNDTATNLGTLGSPVDAEYFSDNVLSPFVINATGKIEQAVIQNGTNDDGDPFPVGQTQGEIRFGSVGSDFNFLHTGNTGFNVTSINFWINGDVDGSPEYTMLSNCNSNGGCTDGIQIYTLDANTRLYMEENNQVKVAGQVIKNSIPADDGQWHMVTIIMDKGNTTGSAIVGCIDAVCQNTATWSADMVGNGNNPTEELALGAVHFQSSLVETTTNYDDFAIWNGFQLTQADIDTLFNVGFVGQTFNQTITDTVTVLDQVNSALNTTESITDTVTVLDDVNATLIPAPVFNVTITDTVTSSDQTETNLPFVPIDDLEAYWKFDHITPTFVSEFIDTTEWQQTGSNINIDNSTTSGQLEIRQENDQSGINAVSHQFPADVSDTEWVFRFPLQKISGSPDVIGASLITFLGIVNTDHTVSIREITSPPSDSIGIIWSRETSDENRMTTNFGDETRLFGNGNDMVFPSAPTDFGTDPRYIEIIRNSATSVTWNVYNDTGYTQLWLTDTRTIPSTIDGMDFIKIGSDDIGGGSGIFDYDIDNVKFWNATTDIHTKLHTEDFVTIDDADSTIEEDMNKTRIGILGNAWKFDDTTDDTRIKIGGSTLSDWDFFSQANSTINFWTIDTAHGNIRAIFGTDGFFKSGTGGAVLSHDDAPSELQYNSRRIAGNAITESSEVIQPFDGNFHMFTMTHDNTNNEIKWYRDGILNETDPTSGNTGEGGALNFPIFGNRQTSPFSSGGCPNCNTWTNATVDEFSIWSRVINATEVSDLYNSGFGLMLNNFDAQQNPPVAPVNQTITDTATVSDQVTVIKQLVSTEKLFAYWKFDNPAIINMTSTNPPATIPDGDVSQVFSVFTIVDGIIDTGYKRGTGATGRIELGANGARAQYDFLVSHRNNITAYNWWMIIPDIDPLVQNQYIFTSWTSDFNPAGIGLVADTRDAGNLLQFDTRNNLGSFLMLEQVNDYLILDSFPQFHMYTIVYDHDAGTVDWYRDGVLFEQDTGAPVCSQVLIDLGRCVFQRTLQIGDIQDSSPEHGCPNCTYDEFSIWNRNLTQADITTLFNNGFGLELDNQVVTLPTNGNASQLQFYYKFNTTAPMINEPFTVIGSKGDTTSQSGVTEGTGLFGETNGAHRYGGVAFEEVNGLAPSDLAFTNVNATGKFATYNFWSNGTTACGAGNGCALFDTRRANNGEGGISFGNANFGLFFQFETSATNLGSYIDDGTYHMYTFIHNGTDNNIYQFRDAVFQTKGQLFVSSLTEPLETQITIGNDNRQSVPLHITNWSNSADELSIWSTDLSITQLELLYNNGTGFNITGTAPTVVPQVFNQTEIDTATVIDDETFVIDKVIRNVEIFTGGTNATIFADNFTSYATQGEADGNWTTTDTSTLRVNISNDELDFNLPTITTSNAGIAFDLNQTINPEWLLRFKLDIDTLNINSDPTGQEVHVGISSADETFLSNNVNQDYIGLKFSCAVSVCAYDVIGADGQAPTTGGAIRSTFSRTPSVETIFVEIIRNSTTSVVVHQYSDASYNTILESSLATIPSGITDLQFVKLMGKNSDGTADGDIIGIVDDIYFVEYDYFDSLETDDFTTLSGTRVSVDTGSRFIDWDSTGTGTYNQGIVIDPLGKELDTENWTLRAKLNITALTVESDTTANDFFLVMSGDNTAEPNLGQDSIGFRISLNNPDGIIRVISSDNTVINSGATQGQVFTTNVLDLGLGDVYLEVVRGVPNSTAVTATFYSDPLYLTPIESVEEVIESGTTGIRYLKVMVSNRDGTGNHTFEGTLDDLTLLDGGANATLVFFTGDLVTVNENLNVTKINGTAIFNQTETDVVIVVDDVNVTKIVAPVSNQTLTDSVTLIDQEQLDITKIFSDNSTVTDQEQLDITKIFSDTTTIIDAETITKNPVPNAINDLSAFAVANTCELTWSTPVNLGLPLAPINGYGIFSSVDGGLFIPIVANTSSTDTAFNHTGLNALSTYLYNVTAFNIYGTSLSSNIDSCVPQSGSDPPSIPTGLTAVNQGENVFLDWDHDGIGNPTGFKIERAVGQGAFFDLVSDTSPDTSTSFLDTTVVPATQFRYRISAINTFGTSDPSGVAGITTLFPPAQPTLMAVQDGNMITLTWTEPTSDQPINGYTIDRRINFASLTTLIANTTTTSLTFDDLNVTKPNVYGYRVNAISSLGAGTVSNIVDVVFGSHTTVIVQEQDGSGFKGGGTVRLQNSTFTLDQALDTGSLTTFNNLDAGNYNFTFIDLDNFILNKTFNFPHPTGNLSNSFTISALVFDVDCPSAGTGTDVRIKVNYTDGKDITEFPATPVCDSSDKVSWSVRWQGDAGVDMSTMVADFISNNFKANADTFLVSSIQTDTSYDSGLNRILSVDYVVNNNVTTTDVTINFDLFLGQAPSSGGSGGGGTPPAGASIPELKIELLQRLTGLSVLSRTHTFVSAGDVIEGSITVEWEGEEPLLVKNIDVGEFSNILRFQIPPFPLEQSIEGSGDFAKSSANIPYVITIPPFICDEMLGITENCVNEELLSLPVEFLFESEGVDYVASTSIMVDLRPIPFDLPQLQIILLGLVLIVSAIAGNFIRQRIRGSDAKRASRGRKKKFKKKFDSS